MKKVASILILGLPMVSAAAAPLSLSQAEHIAIQQAPELKRIKAKSNALIQTSVADARWQDPKLMAGVANLPTNSFSFTQENMTQIQVGLSQQFPRGRSLSIKSLMDRLQAASTQYQKSLMRLTILRTIRVDWLNAFYWLKAIKLYKKEQRLFSHLLSVNSKLLANNQLQQKDVVRAQFELSQSSQQLDYAKQQYEEAKSRLSQWLPTDQKYNFQLPHWSSPPSLMVMQKSMKEHPLLLSDKKKNQVSEQSIQLARQQYIPSVNLGMVYGIRQGDDNMGKRRSDFIGAQLSMDLPFFTRNRQTRRVRASEDEYVSSQMQEVSDYRYLRSQLLENYSAWKRLLSQDLIYRKQLVKEANYYVDSTRIAYQNKQTDFPTLARAYLSSYNTQLAALKVHIGVLQARANLLFLQGK